jgi:hypothetical protein
MNLIYFIERIIQIVNPVINNKKIENRSFPIEFTFLLVIDRVNENLKALNTLIKNDYLIHHHAIGLISRNLLSDFIAIGYVLKSSSKQEIKDKLILLHLSDLKKNNANVKFFKQLEILSQQDVEEYQQQFFNPNNIFNFIQEHASELDSEKFPSNRDIIEIMSQGTDFLSRLIFNCYDSWLFFSKYEHIGWSSFEITRNIKKDKLENVLKFVLSITIVIVRHGMVHLKEYQASEDCLKLYDELIPKEES